MDNSGLPAEGPTVFHQVGSELGNGQNFGKLGRDVPLLEADSDKEDVCMSLSPIKKVLKSCQLRVEAKLSVSTGTNVIHYSNRSEAITHRNCIESSFAIEEHPQQKGNYPPTTTEIFRIHSDDAESSNSESEKISEESVKERATFLSKDSTSRISDDISISTQEASTASAFPQLKTKLSSVTSPQILEHHISKIIFENAVIVDTLDPPLWSKRYFRQASISSYSGVEKELKKLNHASKGRRFSEDLGVAKKHQVLLCKSKLQKALLGKTSEPDTIKKSPGLTQSTQASSSTENIPQKSEESVIKDHLLKFRGSTKTSSGENSSVLSPPKKQKLESECSEQSDAANNVVGCSRCSSLFGSSEVHQHQECAVPPTSMPDSETTTILEQLLTPNVDNELSKNKLRKCSESTNLIRFFKITENENSLDKPSLTSELIMTRPSDVSVIQETSKAQESMKSVIIEPKSHKKIYSGDDDDAPVQTQIDGHAYTFLGLKNATRPTFCCLHKPQPMFVSHEPRLSMYCNWKTVQLPNPPSHVASGYRVLRTRRRTAYTQASQLEFLLTHSSYWSCRKVQSEEEASEEINQNQASAEEHTQLQEIEPQNIPEEEEIRSKTTVEESYTYVRGRGRGRYVCEECGIRCKKPSMLKKHIRTHTDLRPYTCRHCTFAFKTKGNLTKHMKSKAHHKKCVELGIMPVPTAVDDSQIDADALAKQEKLEILGRSMEDDDEDDDDDESEDEEDSDCQEDPKMSPNQQPPAQLSVVEESAPSVKQAEEREAAESLLHLSASPEIIVNSNGSATSSPEIWVPRQRSYSMETTLKRPEQGLPRRYSVSWLDDQPIDLSVSRPDDLLEAANLFEETEVYPDNCQPPLSEAPLSSDQTSPSSPSASGTEEGRCVCSICGKEFANSGQLRLHVNIHYFERPFKCESCAVSFRTKGHLQKHKRSLSHFNKVNMNITFGTPSVDNPRPFKCEDCKIAFRIHGHLSKHLRSKLHIMKLECLGKLPFGIFAEIEKSGSNLNEIDTTDCESSMKSLQEIANKLYHKNPKRLRWQGEDSAPKPVSQTEAFPKEEANKSLLQRSCTCHICGRLCKSTKFLQIHLYCDHTNTKNISKDSKIQQEDLTSSYMCHECGNTFSQATDFQRHYQSHATS